MTDRSQSRAPRLVALVASAAIAAGGLLGVAGPAGAVSAPTAPQTKTTYAALGDSYAAGVGGGDYYEQVCFTSPNGYPVLLSGEAQFKRLALEACSGATTADVIAEQLDALDHRTKVVTLTVGANDLGVGALSAYCLTHTSEECLAALQVTLLALSALDANLDATLAAIREAAPKATVYVTGYPLLFSDTTGDPRYALVNQGVRLLNAEIAEAVAAAGAGFVYVDVTDEFTGHGIGSGDSWILDLTDPLAFHPNAEGYVAYAEAIRSAM